jgi:hypothetical protein
MVPLVKGDGIWLAFWPYTVVSAFHRPASGGQTGYHVLPLRGIGTGFVLLRLGDAALSGTCMANKRSALSSSH